MESSSPTLLRAQDKERWQMRAVTTRRPDVQVTFIITWRLEGDRRRGEGGVTLAITVGRDLNA